MSTTEDPPRSTEDAPLLSIQDLEVTFEEETAIMEVVPESIKERFGWESQPIRAVDGVSLDIGEKDVVAIIGESGSGKTTLGKAAVDLIEPTGGTIEYRGYDIQEVKRENRVDDLFYEDIRRSLQIVHQDPGASLNPYRTIMSSLKDPLRLWWPELTHADCRARILEMFRLCGLTPVEEYENRYPHELSGGEKQRVALIRAMLMEPDLILADEPVSALDPSLGIAILDLMLELQKTFETSFIFVSHNLEHARYITSHANGRIAIMYLGEIVEYGPVEEVLQNPKHPYTKILKWATLSNHPDRAREKLEAQPPLRSFEIPDITNPPSGCRFHTRCPKARETCAMEAPAPVSTNGDGAHTAACFLEEPNHEYWQTEFLDERGEIEIPE